MCVCPYENIQSEATTLTHFGPKALSNLKNQDNLVHIRKAMTPEQLKDIFSIIEIVNIAISYVVNTFLLWVVLRQSKGTGSYKLLLLAFTINDIYFPFIHALTFPVICSYNDAFFMFSYGILHSKFSICLFASAHSQAMPIIANLFFYRLIALKWFCNCWFGYAADDELSAYAQPFLDHKYSRGGEGLIGALYYNKHGLRWKAVLATMGLNTIMTYWFAQIVMCSVLIVRVFRNAGTTWSSRTKRLQRQMFRTLLLQMIVPILCVYLPCAGQINLPIFARVQLYPNPVSAAFTFFPVLDAIITLIGVRNYRKYGLSLILKAVEFSRRLVQSIR